MMRHCSKCFENNWSYKHVEGWVIATCLGCGEDVEFQGRGGVREKMTIGDTCRKCKEGVIVGKTAKKPKTYSAYYFCPKCKTIYFSDEFLV